MKKLFLTIILASLLLIQWSDNPTEPIELLSFRSPNYSYIEDWQKIGTDRFIISIIDIIFHPGYIYDYSWSLKLFDKDGNALWGPSGRKFTCSAVEGNSFNLYLNPTEKSDELYVVVSEFQGGLGLKANRFQSRMKTAQKMAVRPSNEVQEKFTIHLNKMDKNGNLIWGDNWVSHHFTSPIGYSYTIPDGAGCLYLLSLYRRTPDYDYRINHIDSNGQLTWGSEGISVLKGKVTTEWPEVQYHPQPDGKGIFAVIKTKPGPYQNIYVQRLNSDGQIQYPSPGIPIRDGLSGRVTSDTVYTEGDGSDGIIVGWQDNRPWDYPGLHIFAQRVDGSGNVLWKENGVWISSGSSYRSLWFTWPVYMDMKTDNAGGAIFSWRSNEGLRMQRVDGNGQLKWDPKGIAIDERWKSRSWSANWDYVPTSPGKFMVLWSNVTTAWTQLYDLEGNALWSKPFEYRPSDGYRVEYPYIFNDWNSGAILVYEMEKRFGWSGYAMKTVAHHIDEDGNLGTNDPNRENMIIDDVIILK